MSKWVRDRSEFMMIFVPISYIATARIIIGSCSFIFPHGITSDGLGR